MTAKSPREIKQELIIRAAIQVFSDKGYHNATMGEIATIAGIGKATIYEYFSSKLQLFQTMMESGLRFYYDNLDSEISEPLTFEKRIKMLFESHISFCREYGKLTRIILWDTEVFDEELKDWMMQTRKNKENVLRNIISEGIKQGEVREMDPTMATIMIGGTIGHLWGPLVLDEWDVETSQLAETMTELIMHGIK